MTVTARKYNPGFLTDDELVASFCVRTEEFESMVEALRECTGSANTHQIVIGPRGSGKTSLLLRVAAEVRRDEGLSSRFFPIVFAEESYEVSTAGEFWLECLSRLADQASSVEDGPDLRGTFEELRQIPDDRTLGERCLGALQDFADRERKCLVLVVENLNMLLGDIGDEDTGWQLRHTLQTEPRVLLLASATSRFDEIDNPDKAFYDLFRVLVLRPLDRDDCATLWQAVSGRRRAPETIQALRILTGGSPRLLTIVARFGSELSFRELMADLLNLVDDHTEYFKSHLDGLPAQERKIYLALLQLWKPVSAREIADQTRQGTSKCSAQLKRLTARGVVEVAGGTERRKLYYVAERLYNIYYLVRRARGPAPMIEALIRFMEGYYSDDELRDLGTRIAQEASGLDGDTLGLYRTAFDQLVHLPSMEAHREELLSLAASTLGVRARDTSIASLSASLAKELVGKGLTLAKAGRFEDAADAWGEVVERFGTSDSGIFPRVVATALVNKGACLNQLNRPGEALASWDDVVHRFGASDKSTLLELVAFAMFCRGTLLHQMNQLDEAVTAWNVLADHFSETDAPKILERVAFALERKVILLLQMNQPEESLAIADEVVRRFSGNEAPEIVSSVATTLANRGLALIQLSRADEAMKVWGEVEQRFGTSESPKLRNAVETALLGMAIKEFADAEVGTGIATVNRVFDRGGAGSPGIEWLACTIRAWAHLVEGDVAACIRDVEAGLVVVPSLDALPKESLNLLSGLAVELGSEKMRDLIKASPAADLLLPLTTALEMELGLEPRVAKEVEEVAEDIRRDLEERRKAKSGDGGASALDPGSGPG